MNRLNSIDYSVIALYFVVLLAIGLYFKKRAGRGIESYFLGDRQLPWWALGLSSMAAWFDMTGTMVITSFLFMLGPRGLYIEGFRGGACLVLVFLLLWTGKWHRRSGVVTAAEWMIFRFGDNFWGNAARVAQAFSMVLFSIGILAYSFKGAGLFLAMFMPFSPMTCTIILLIITTIYTLEGGFYGVVITDIIQTICIVAAVGVIVIQTVLMVIGKDIGALAQSVTGNSHWLSSFPTMKTSMPKGYEQYSLMGFMAMFYLMKTAVQGVGMGGDPRYFGARNDRECGLLSWLCGWCMAIRWPMMIAFAVMGLFLISELFPDHAVMVSASEIIRSHFPAADIQSWPDVIANIMNHPEKCDLSLISGLQGALGSDWSAKLSLVSFNGEIEPERIVPAVLLFKVPLGVRGLIIVGLLAAAMSTFNAFINLASSFVVRDFYQAYLRPNAGSRELVWASYISGFVIVASGFAMTYSAKSINDIWGWLMMGLTGGMIIPTALRLYWWRFNGCGFASGIIVGMAAAFIQRIAWPQMNEWLQFILVSAASLVGCIIGTYVTRPTDLLVLKKFYFTTRPFGLWRPMFNLLDERARMITTREHFYDLLSLPFAFGWQLTILLIPMQLIILQYKDAFWTCCLLAVSLIGMYFFWYKKLPAENFLDEIRQPETSSKGMQASA